jgi:hypothetical protein
MTAQIPEDLLLDGEAHALLATPLDDYFQMGGFNPGFLDTSSALWRGYTGSWQIIGERLYLTELSGCLKSGAQASLESVFSGFKDRVFAHWFSGTIRLPMGKLLKYVHQGFASRYERDIFLKIKEGVLVSKSERHNGQDDESAHLPRAMGVAVTCEDFDAMKAASVFKIRPEYLGKVTCVADVVRMCGIFDPLGAVPDAPFGHLSCAWDKFVSQRPEGAELYPLSCVWTNVMRGTFERKGFVWVTAGVYGPFWLFLDWKLEA